jgi:Na+/H+ antiporter NhaD/arsenite permease-like protein
MIAAAIFVATFVMIALGRVPGLRLDRAGAALVGAAAMLACGVVTPAAAWRMVDLETLALLLGVMLLVGQLRLSGFFLHAGVALARRARTPRQLLFALVMASGVLSALFVNDTVCLALTPLVLDVAAALGVPATPYLLALATASNIGSVATPTGNPQNMLIAVHSGIGYRAFLGALAPVAVLGLVADFAVIAWVYRAQMRVPFVLAATPRVRLHRAVAGKALVCASLMVAAFWAGANLAVAALAAGSALLVTRRIRAEKLFRQVDGGLLVLFAGLFVVVGAAREAGLTEAVFTLLHAREATTVASIAAGVAVLSNVVSNVPAVMLFLPLVPALPDPRTGWLALAMASTLAGNLTLVGSIANLIVAEGARRRSPLSFGEYLRVGVPVTLLTLVLGVLLLR